MKKRTTKQSEKRMFLCVKNGILFNIIPQNAAGWRALILWTLILLSPFLPSAIVSAALENTAYAYLISWLDPAAIVLMLILCVVMVRWALARSDVIDVKEWKRRNKK